METPRSGVGLEPVGEVTTRYNTMGIFSIKRGMGSSGLDDITQGEIMESKELKRAQVGLLWWRSG